MCKNSHLFCQIILKEKTLKQQKLASFVIKNFRHEALTQLPIKSQEIECNSKEKLKINAPKVFVKSNYHSKCLYSIRSKFSVRHYVKGNQLQTKQKT